MKKILMKEMYPDMITGDGIMSDLSDFDVPWAAYITDGLINQTDLDIGYFSVSADKIVSPFMLEISNNMSNIREGLPIDDLTTEQRGKIAGVIFTLFNRKWQHFWDINIAEYNPIHNYNMTESETYESSITDEGTSTGSVTTVIDKNTTNTGTVTTVTDEDSTQTGTVSDSGSESGANNLYGFNSASAVGHDTNSGTSSNTRTDNLAGTEDVTNTRTDNLAFSDDTTDTETRDLATSNENTKESSRVLEKSGNIGVTTTQKLIESELEVWKWSFFKTVFQDIDSVCCLDIY